MHDITTLIRGEPRWIRNEDGEYRVTFCIHPDDVTLAQRLFDRSGLPQKTVIFTQSREGQAAVEATSKPKPI